MRYSKIELIDTRKDAAWKPVQAVLRYFDATGKVSSAVNYNRYETARLDYVQDLRQAHHGVMTTLESPDV